MKNQSFCSFLAIASAVAVFAVGSAGAKAFAPSAPPPKLEQSNPSKPGVSDHAPRHGHLPASAADVAFKAAADHARENTERSAKYSAPAPALIATPLAVVTNLNVAGLGGTQSSPADATGAIGPTRFIQLVNTSAAIFSRTSGAKVASASLNTLANVAASVQVDSPQIIWDATTYRYYYSMIAKFSDVDWELSFGFSKNGNPSNLATDWCHYQLLLGSRVPDYPKLGDSRYFMIVGVNSFAPGFVGSDLVAVSKPPTGSACPDISSFKVGVQQSLGNAFSPVPANQIDRNDTGYVVARNLTLSGGAANTLWLFDVTRNPATGMPVFSTGRSLTVASYAMPASATQPTFSQLLDTSDMRMSQAVQAMDPRLGTFSLWTQHTIANGTTGSRIRWYQIDPVPAVPVVQRTGNISASNTFMFNGAISPDRKVDGATIAFGQNAVIQYNMSSATIPPRIMGGSSVNGAAFTVRNLRSGVGPYRDFTCPNPGDICSWGNWSTATPDPRPTTTTTGQVWGTNQFSGLLNPPANTSNFRTRIFSLTP